MRWQMAPAMIDGIRRHVLLGSVLLVLCWMLLLFMRLLPVSGIASGWPGADLGLCLLFAWVLRRPDQIPALLLVLLVLCEDVLLLRPLGLWTLFVRLGTEAARQREVRWRDQPFVVEWLRVSILIGGMMLGFRVMQMLFLLPVPVLWQVTLQFIATVAAYPIVVLLARWLVGLRSVTPAEAEMMRHI